LSRIALFALTRTDAEAARALAAGWPQAEVHVPARIALAREHAFDEAAAALARLLHRGLPVVAFCAAGIVVRLSAPHLAGKRKDPPVLVVDAHRRHVVPLFGAHRARALAAELAQRLGATVVETDRSAAAGLPALDVPPPGFRPAHHPHLPALLRRLAEGEGLRVEDPDGLLPPEIRTALPEDPSARLVLEVGERARPPHPDRLLWHPQLLVVGVGTSRGAPPEALVELVEATLAEAGLAPEAVACVASLDRKMDEPAVHATAARLGVPARFFSARELAAEASRLARPSAAVAEAVGVPGVAEAAALAAVGPDGRLVVDKRRNAVATCAVARAPHPVDPAKVGRPRGRVEVIGLGPGDPAHLTRAVEEALARAEHLVGYAGYLELLGPWAEGRHLHPFPLGAELERCARALELAADGARVALVCSGDPGIYAMASPLFELLAGLPANDPRRRVEVTVHPGITAAQAAAAAAGALLGHDFCCVSLSDLLTPREVILRRIEAAAAADFVIALYNPASSRRRGLLPAALSAIARHRPPATPVVMARALGREGACVRVLALCEVDPEEVDMLTTLLVGSSKSRTLELGGRTLAFTPRGYRP